MFLRCKSFLFVQNILQIYKKVLTMIFLDIYLVELKKHNLTNKDACGGNTDKYTNGEACGSVAFGSVWL